MYQLRQPTAAEIVSQQYSIALYQQFVQYNYITDLEYSIFASSNSSAESEQVVETESINQLQQKIYSYDYVYSQLKKTNKNTFYDRLIAAIKTLSEIFE